MNRFLVYGGEYPFERYVGFVDMPTDDPQAALQAAIKTFKTEEHPVIMTESAVVVD